MMINRAQLNSIANKVKKVLNDGIKEGKNIDDIIFSDDMKKIIGDGSATGDNDCTVYDFDLGKFDGRITKTSLDKDDVKHFGCTRIDTDEVIFTIDEDLKENKITASASVRIDWCNKYGRWTEEFITIKNWEII